MAEKSLTADLPIGLDGLYGSKNPAQLPPSALVLANNMTFIDGTLKKEGGASKYNATAIPGAPRILAGIDWWPDTATQRSVILTSAGDLLKDSGSGTYPVTLASGLAVSAPLGAFVTGGKEAAAVPRKLFCFTGVDPVQVLSGDGATTSVISGAPADWSGSNQPLGGLIHQGRLFGFGNLNDPHRLYYSTTSDHEAPTSTIGVYSGVGERILACFSIRGFILVFKHPHGIFAIDTRSSSPSDWRVDKVSDEIGICGIGGAVFAEKSIIFFDSSGNIQILEQVTTDAFSITNIGQLAQIKSFINNNLELTELEKVKGVFYPKDREIHFAVPHLASLENNRRFVMDFNKEQPRFRYSDRDMPISMWLRKIGNAPRLAMGDAAGFVWDLDTVARSKDGAGYEIRFESAPTDLSFLDPALGGKRKNGRFLELIYEPTGTFDLSVDLIWDGNLESTYSFSMGGSGTGFILGTSILGIGTLGTTSVLQNVRRRITGSGKRIALRGYNSGTGENISVSRFILHFVPSDERVNV